MDSNGWKDGMFNPFEYKKPCSCCTKKHAQNPESTVPSYLDGSSDKEFDATPLDPKIEGAKILNQFYGKTPFQGGVEELLEDDAFSDVF